MASFTGIPAEFSFSFGRFRLLPGEQILLEDEKPVRLGSRALDILTMLVEHAGELVSRDELTARVWPDTFVEESSLRVHIAGLRRVLGDGHAGKRYVANIPGRGYRFVAPVAVSEQTDRPAPKSPTAAPAHNLPASLTRMVGRDAVTNTLSAELPRRRFITIVGPGGIGKTTVALAVADRRIAAYRDGVRYVDLAPLTDPLLVPTMLASVFGLASGPGNRAHELVAFLGNKRVLIVLDSCEHVVESAAALAVELLKSAPGLNILATCREPLSAEGECVRRLMPLKVPAATRKLSATEALAYPAVQLFVERAIERLDTFELTDADAPIVAEICRKLDGIALAIELAAGRVDAFGLRELATLLNDRFRLLMRGRRTALRRHQTLNAALDWSYEFLQECERIILRRLAVFDSYFTLESAIAVAEDSKIAMLDVVNALANLVANSLIIADIGGDIVHYRLLETTRVYARGKLAESGERRRVTQRHAENLQNVLEQAGLALDGTPLMRVR
ncbi:MAG: helix-turn-helix transcriptional regulator [Hyphomicrobiales bacterium]|nr:helix-turn-helix transcriptional regulator [Hyphomicrobiales bacterium]